MALATADMQLQYTLTEGGMRIRAISGLRVCSAAHRSVHVAPVGEDHKGPHAAELGAQLGNQPGEAHVQQQDAVLRCRRAGYCLMPFCLQEPLPTDNMQPSPGAILGK